MDRLSHSFNRDLVCSSSIFAAGGKGLSYGEWRDKLMNEIREWDTELEPNEWENLESQLRDEELNPEEFEREAHGRFGT